MTFSECVKVLKYTGEFINTCTKQRPWLYWWLCYLLMSKSGTLYQLRVVIYKLFHSIYLFPFYTCCWPIKKKYYTWYKEMCSGHGDTVWTRCFVIQMYTLWWSLVLAFQNTKASALGGHHIAVPKYRRDVVVKLGISEDIKALVISTGFYSILVAFVWLQNLLRHSSCFGKTVCFGGTCWRLSSTDDSLKVLEMLFAASPVSLMLWLHCRLSVSDMHSSLYALRPTVAYVQVDDIVTVLTVRKCLWL